MPKRIEKHRVLNDIESRYNIESDRDMLELSQFSGVAISAECFLKNNDFRNFRFVLFHIKDGEIVKVEKTQDYASFEIVDDGMDMMRSSINSLNHNWKQGKTLSEQNVKTYRKFQFLQRDKDGMPIKKEKL